jgi:para-aminobenzoate synthetase component I
MRLSFSTTTDNIPLFKKNVLQWLNGFDTFCYLDNNEYADYGYSNYELLAAAGKRHVIECNTGNAFQSLQEFLSEHRDWTFGHFNYDLKNEIEKQHSANADRLHFPDLFFFVPEHIICIKAGSSEVTIESANAEKIYQKITAIGERHCEANSDAFVEDLAKQCPSERLLRFARNDEKIEIQSRYAKEEYLNIVEIIREHIAEGDFYEMNLCMEFFAEKVKANPSQIFEKLNDINKAPFTSFFKNKNHYLICSSPERFLMKQGNKIVSQPIKGTIKKGTNEAENNLLKAQLQHDEKERAENVMIVDLVRNDLARSCKAGSVKVEELFSIYSFKQVHQMISTVSGVLRENIPAVQAIKNAFPMGSMTGAPKVIVMEHIEKYEQTKRGLYSGAFGYFTPEQDFDFNVVIRSILYNAETQYLSFQTGSAITFDSVAEKEYEECLVKAEAMKQAIQG